MTPESVIYSFGTLLLDLISGKHIPPSHVRISSYPQYFLQQKTELVECFKDIINSIDRNLTVCSIDIT